MLHPPVLPSVSQPPAMYARAKPRPRAWAPARALPAVPQTLFSGPATIGGRTGTLAVVFTPDNSPPPPPPPPVGLISSVTTWNALPLSAGKGGDFILINGKGFGLSRGTVTIAGIAAPVAELHRWTDLQIALFLPTNTGPDLSGPIIVTPPGKPAITSPLMFTLAGTGVAPPPPPGDPIIRSYQDGNRTPGKFFVEGATVRVVGTGFGATPGRLLLAGAFAPFLSWSDTEVDFTAPKATIAGSTVSTSPWYTVGIMRADRKGYTDQWGVKFQQPRLSPTATQEADPIPLPWASEPPVWVETQPFAVGGRYFALQMQIKPAPGTAPDPPPTPLPPVVTAPVIAAGRFFTLEVTPVPVAGGPPAAGVK